MFCKNGNSLIVEYYLGAPIERCFLASDLHEARIRPSFFVTPAKKA